MLMQKGYAGEVYGKKVREVLSRMGELTEKYGNEDEKEYLKDGKLYERLGS